jgi:hypothetical protein
MYWILSEFLSHTLAIFPSLTLLGGAENVGYITSAMNLANIVEDQAKVTEQSTRI